MTAADLESRELIEMLCFSFPKASCIEGNDSNFGGCTGSFSGSDVCLDSGGEIYPLLPLAIPMTELAADDG